MKKLGAGVLFIFVFIMPAYAQKQWSVAITLDDMPAVTYQRGEEGTKEAEEINRRLLEAFARHHVKATGFVNEQKVEEDSQSAARTVILESWLKAGHTLGNHTYSHPKFSAISLEDFEKNTTDGERSITPLLAKYKQRLRFFRFPYNDTGGTPEKKTAFDKFLIDHHYEIATCTEENLDWMYENVYHAALAKGDTKHAAEVREAYLDQTRRALDQYEKIGLELFGRPFPQVMLMHANHLNADLMDEVLKIFEQRGYKFVSLSEAQKNPAYRTPDVLTEPWGILWQQRWDLTLHRGTPGGPTKSGGPQPPKWVTEEYAAAAKTGY